ncbi:MAG: hypothetical protein AB7K24_28660 [Gemmataceae bacterium]
MKLGTTLRRLLLLLAIGLLLLAGYIGLASIKNRSGRGGSSVIQRAIEAHGGETALRRARTGTVKGTALKLDRQSLTPIRPFQWEEAFDRGDKVRATLHIKLPGHSITQVYLLPAGESWQQQPDGSFHRQGEVPQGVEPILSPFHKLLQIRQDELPVVRLEDEVIDGSPAAVVEVESPDWGTVIFYFDQGNGRLIKLSKEIDLPGDKKVVMSKTFSRFKRIDGAVLPTRILELRDAEPDRELNVVEASLGGKIDPALFTKP